MAEEIDEVVGFYREDFSTGSDFEVFNAQLSEIFEKWELSNPDWGNSFEKNELFMCDWNIRVETLQLLGQEILVKYYSAISPEVKEGTTTTTIESTPLFHADLMSAKNTFSPLKKGKDLHPLTCLFGLRRFVVMHPKNKYLTDPAEFSFFLSSATVCCSDASSTVPIFLKIYDPKWNYFLGVGLAKGMRTNFDLVALEKAPSDCQYLSGLLGMFKEKHPTTHSRTALVSVQNTYNLSIVSVVPMRVPFSKAPTAEEEKEMNAVKLSSSIFTALPHGYFPDSSTEIFITYTWPEIAENMVMDSALRSDFLPTKAPYGNLHTAVHATAYLTSCLYDYQKLRDANQTLEYYVGRNFSGTTTAAEIANPLDQLTKPHLRHIPHRKHEKLSNAITAKAMQKKLPGPMNESELNQMLYYLFPDLHPDVALFPYDSKCDAKQKFDPHRIKSAEYDSLVSRLSSLLATCNAHFGGKSGLAQLWASFTRELRFLWDYSIIVPGVAPGFPDMRTGLLHQKLQMLNVCIERCIIRDSNVKSDLSKETQNDSVITSDEENDSEEFFDCDNYEDYPVAAAAAAAGSLLSPTTTPTKPEGRKQKLGDKKLLDNPEESLYIPITQEPVAKTEDQLQDDAEAMLKHGPGSGISTQMMCSSLLSDMEAFKAANPNSKMEDFIRWYSPNDWEETVNENGESIGKLSVRMTAPGNTWQAVWEQAKPVPAWRQKRLFDDTNEALKVLQYLETRSMSEIFELTVIPMLHAAILKLKDIFNESHVLELFESKIDNALANLSRMSRDVEVVGQNENDSIIQTPNPEPIIQQIEALEMDFYQFKCFEKLILMNYDDSTTIDNQLPLPSFNEIKRQFAEILKNNGSVTIVARKVDQPVAAMLHPNFVNNLAEHLISKDYVIRDNGETTITGKGKTGPQFLRAVVTGQKLRLCGAFTESTTFI